MILQYLVGNLAWRWTVTQTRRSLPHAHPSSFSYIHQKLNCLPYRPTFLSFGGLRRAPHCKEKGNFLWFLCEFSTPITLIWDDCQPLAPLGMCILLPPLVSRWECRDDATALARQSRETQRPCRGFASRRFGELHSVNEKCAKSITPCAFYFPF